MKFLQCESISKTLLDEIRTEKKVILHNYAEPYSLFPYLKGGFHNEDEDSNNRAIFYHLLTEFDDTFDITFVGADIHLKQNYEKVKQVVDSTLNLKIISFPWFFVYEYWFPGDISSYFLKDDLQISTKYNGIFLSGGRRLCRYHIMSELSKYDNFLFSNLGYLDEEVSVSSSTVLDYELLDDCFSVTCGMIGKHGTEIQEKVLLFGDDPVFDYSFNFNNFYSSEKIYFKSDLKLYQNPDLVAFENDYFSRDQKVSISQLEKKYQEKKHPRIPFQLCPWYWYNIVPDEYLESAVNFVCESQTDIATHVTEKTVKNFFYKKPFLTFGCKNFYKFLTDHGFVLYDELFDYSFDEIEHYGKRLKAYIIECEKILQMDLNDLINIIDTFKDKLDHNHQVCSDISYEVYKLPPSDRYDKYQEKLINIVKKK
tara:strand:+ start:7213 stop:8487 length:1275 start_codon:yes stop_codon:yes gene_type:complete